MIVSCLLKPRFIPVLIIIFVTLHLSACGTEQLLTAIAPEIGSATEAGIDDINHAAKINGVDSGNVIEDVDPDGDNLLEVSGKLNIKDNDAGEEAFIAKTVNGDYGVFDIDTAGNWNYAAGNQQNAIQNLSSNATLTEYLMVSSVDGTTHTITIKIIGIIDSVTNTNNAAVITGVDSGSVTEDLDDNDDDFLRANGKLNITDSNAGEAAFIFATINGNYGQLLILTEGSWWYYADDNQSVIQNLATGATLTDSLTVSSVDGTTHTIVITIVGVNDTNNNTATVSLSWVAPSEREDNQPISLSEIDGYKIYYGTTPGKYPNKVTIDDSTAVGYTFTRFPTGTHYFVVTTLDTAGRESRHSTVTTVN